MDVNEISGHVVDAAMKVHTALGPGLLESAYEACLLHELRKRGLRVAAQSPLPICYDGLAIDVGYRLDMVVESVVVVELKAVDKLLPIHEAQLLSYLKLSGCQVGLLINFHVPRLKDGIKRMVNGAQENLMTAPPGNAPVP
ncbi:MAG: GxxExxY protein [Pirellulales bacterium]